MMPCRRPPAPRLLAERADGWTAAWLRRREEDQGAEFRWPIVDGRPLNQHLLPALDQMVDGHCAYCDGWPLDETGRPSIDHFRPKSRFPELAYAWDNLFHACQRCQEPPDGKGARWSEDLLRPDASDFSFDRYFRYDVATGRLEPNPQASDADQRRARVTIELLGLNAGSRPVGRKRARRHYGSYVDEVRPYRFVYEAREADPG